MSKKAKNGRATTKAVAQQHPLAGVQVEAPQDRVLGEYQQRLMASEGEAIFYKSRCSALEEMVVALQDKLKEYEPDEDDDGPDLEVIPGGKKNGKVKAADPREAKSTGKGGRPAGSGKSKAH